MSSRVAAVGGALMFTAVMVRRAATGVLRRSGARRSLVAGLAGLVLATGGLVAMAGPAQAAACGRVGNDTVCISTLAASPVTVASASGAAVRVTASVSVVSGPVPTCLRIRYSFPGLFPDVEASLSTPAPGTSTTFTGTLTVPAFVRPGTYDPVAIGSCVTAWEVGADTLNANGLTGARLTITGASDTASPTFLAFTAPSSVIDVTTGDRPVAVSTRVTDAVSGVRLVRVLFDYTPGATAHPLSLRNYQGYTDLTRSSGTANDGIWTGSLVIPAGTRGTFALSLLAADQYGNPVTVPTAAMAAAGVVSSLTSNTTAVPLAPTSVKGTNVTEVNTLGQVSHINARITWAYPATGPRPTNSTVASASSACGTLVPAGAFGQIEKQATFRDRILVLPCSVSVRLVNAAGLSPVVKVTYW